MSDSDTDEFSNNVFTYQNRSTQVCAKGPNGNTTRFSVHNNNMLTSTMNMHWNMDRRRYAESVYDHRSRSRRETSPMSFHSVSGVPLRNLHQSYYPGGMSSQRSTYNGRSGSPMSVRTIDSNTSATDIAFALKTRKFNKFDMKIIKEAYNKFIKHRVRKRIEKRRNLRTFLKGCRRKSGGESGEQASDSSLSSDDHRSVKSFATFNDNAMSRSDRINITHLKKTMKESGMYKDCTDNFRQNRFPNMLSVPPGNVQENLQPRLNNTSVMCKNNRFKNGFLLPSQRFNASQLVAPPIPETLCVGPQIINSQIINEIQNGNQNTFNQNRDHTREPSQEAISEQEEIFSEITMMQKNNEPKSQRKRAFDEEDIPFNRKKNKLSTPVKKCINPNTFKPKQTARKPNSKGIVNDFVFTKPQLPVKKLVNVNSLNVKPQQVPVGKSKSFQTNGIISSKTQSPQNGSNSQQQETLISKSQAPVEVISQIQTSEETVYQSPEKLISKSSQPLDLEQQRTQNLPHNNYEKDQHEMTHSTTDMSMRPSFIKRKLFTQKVDESENTESLVSLQNQGPQSNIYSKIQNEKHKARKLVTQSCLSRDLEDDSNLLDLIHKIVPPDRMNLTTATNKSEIQINKSKPANSDKWDITEIITTNKSEELSDTYTDDEIFKNDETQQNQAKKKQNDVKENNKQNMNKNKPANNKNSPLKTIDKQSKLLLRKNCEKGEINKRSDKTDTNKTDMSMKTKNCLIMPSSPKVVLQKLSPQIVMQKEKVENLKSNNEQSSCDCNKKVVYCVKSFWSETDSDYAATPLKKPERKGLPAMNHSVSNQRNNNQIETPIEQVITAKTNLDTNIMKANDNKLLNDAPEKDKVIQSKKKTGEKLQANKNVLIQVQPNKRKSFSKDLKSKQKNTESSKETYANPTPKDIKVNTSRKEKKVLKNNNNTLHIRSQSITKTTKSCTNHKLNDTVNTLNESQLCRTLRSKLNDTVNTSNESQLCKTLRSRVIDLSTSLNKQSSPLNKKTALKNKQKHVKDKNVTKLRDKENILKTSDQSFTLSAQTPLANKLAANKRVYKVNNVKLNVTKSRQSDVSFILGDVLNHTTTNTRRHKKVEKLQLGTSKFESGKNSSLRRVESTRLNNSRSSARLNRSKVY